MTEYRWTDDDCREIDRQKNTSGFQWSDLDGFKGKSWEAARAAWRRWKGRDSGKGEVPLYEPPTIKEYDHRLEASCCDERIKTLEQLIDACEIDLSLWQIDKHIINTWEVGAKDASEEIQHHTLHQVKAWLSPRAIQPFEVAFDGLVERLASQAPKVKKTKYKPQGDHLLAIQMYDPHFGKLSATEDWTLAIASDTIRAIGKALVAQARSLPYKVDRIQFPVGNDIFQADDLSGRTTLGTWVDTCASQADIIDTVLMDYIYLIELFSLLAPVDIAIVQSNHDRQNVHWLGRALWAYFHNNPNVTIDGDFYPRKYYRYGVNLLGMEHGDKVKPGKLALLMATEAKEDWSATSYWEWWRGHIHSERSMLTAITEEVGVKVRTIPALCPPDMWHLLRGFDGARRAAYGMYYHRENGPGVEFPVYVNEVLG
jgi:hypothetical protein